MYNSYSSPSYYSSASDMSGLGSIVGAILGLGVLFWLLVIAAAVVTLVARWKLFKKANIDGWESLIPIHSDIVELKLGGVSSAVWFFNLIVLCGVGPLIVSFWKSIALSKAFGKGTGFGVLMAFFPFVCYPILAFGDAQYVGTGATKTETSEDNPTV